jgi:hypothetical protein
MPFEQEQRRAFDQRRQQPQRDQAGNGKAVPSAAVSEFSPVVDRRAGALKGDGQKRAVEENADHRRDDVGDQRIQQRAAHRPPLKPAEDERFQQNNKAEPQQPQQRKHDQNRGYGNIGQNRHVNLD